MGGSRSEGHTTVRRNKMEGMRKIQREMEASSEGGQGPEGAAAPQMDG
jgi:hypothetical protein